MLPKDTLPQLKKILKQEFLPCVCKKHQGLFKFGFQALTLSKFESLNSNAREVIANRNTAESKVYRLVSKDNFEQNFLKIIRSLLLIKPKSLVNVDFSTFYPFQVLTFGIQTLSGRALPFFFDSLTYPILKPTSQNWFIIDKIKELKSWLGFCPKLVLDRGFMIPVLVKFLVKEKITFYLRLRAGSLKKTFPGQGKSQEDYIQRYGFRLRLVVSQKPKGKTKSGLEQEPWYILTNDFTTKRSKIIKIYYHRFEVEENFKDLKHLQKLNKFQIKRKLTFRILFWFCLLRVVVSYLLEAALGDRVKRTTHTKKALSWFRFWFEQVNFSFKQVSYQYLFEKGG